MAGKLIVLDGLDGAGKATQQKLLAKRLRDLGYTVKTISFPQYEEFFGRIIGRGLMGEFGNWVKIDPHILSIIYAADRFHASKKMKNWLKKGYIVIADRYVSANQLYQAGKIPHLEKRKEFLRWLDELEYEQFKIPRPDLVVYLDVPVNISLKLSLKSANKKKSYAKGQKQDTHEKDAELLEKVRKNALEFLTKLYKDSWRTIRCVDRRGRLMSPRKIAEKIFAVVKKELKL